MRDVPLSPNQQAPLPRLERWELLRLLVRGMPCTRCAHGDRPSLGREARAGRGGALQTDHRVTPWHAVRTGGTKEPLEPQTSPGPRHLRTNTTPGHSGLRGQWRRCSFGRGTSGRGGVCPILSLSSGNGACELFMPRMPSESMRTKKGTDGLPGPMAQRNLSASKRCENVCVWWALRCRRSSAMLSLQHRTFGAHGGRCWSPPSVFPGFRSGVSAKPHTHTHVRPALPQQTERPTCCWQGPELRQGIVVTHRIRLLRERTGPSFHGH